MEEKNEQLNKEEIQIRPLVMKCLTVCGIHYKIMTLNFKFLNFRLHSGYFHKYTNSNRFISKIVNCCSSSFQ